MEASSHTEELPIEPEKIPDRWDIIHDPTNIDPDSVVLEYGDSEGDPVATVCLLTPNTERGSDDDFVVEVQDANADGASMNYLNPLAVWEPHVTLSNAVDHFYEMGEKYPLPATRE